VQKRLFELLDAMQQKKILVLGDMVADVYLEGKIARISREAPVLVLEYAGEKVVPGGAANVVLNAAVLGGFVRAVGVIGADDTGRELVRCLQERTVDTTGLIKDEIRPTTTKTRIMAGAKATVRQQVVRVDREDRTPLSAQVENGVLTAVKAAIDQSSAVVMSDYGGSAISPAILRQVIDLCRDKDIPCIVDSRYNILAYKGATVIKQNESEITAALGYDSLNEGNLLAAGRQLLERLEAQAIMLTRGPEGMSIFEPSGRVTHIPVVDVSEVFDVTGAGDTAVAAMALALAAGAGYVEAAQIANFAAGVVVTKFGAATVSPAELKEVIGSYYENCNG